MPTTRHMTRSTRPIAPSTGATRASSTASPTRRRARRRCGSCLAPRPHLQRVVLDGLSGYAAGALAGYALAVSVVLGRRAVDPTADAQRRQSVQRDHEPRPSRARPRGVTARDLTARRRPLHSPGERAGRGGTVMGGTDRPPLRRYDGRTLGLVERTNDIAEFL